MASEKILDFDFSNVIGYDVLSSTGLIQDSGFGAIPNYSYNFQCRFTLQNDFNMIETPHIRIEYKRYNSDTIETLNSTDTYNNGIYQCALESSGFGQHPITIVDVICSGLASVYAPFNSDFPMLRVQKVDLTTQNIIAENRFYGDLQQQNPDYVDLGQFINSIVRYPFAVETGSNADLMLGFVILNTQAPLLTKRIYDFIVFNDFINGIFRDSRDCNNVEIYAMLPFHGKYTIDEKYINRNIKIVYEVDIMTNESTIKIYSGNVLIDTLNVTIGFSIPYIIKIDSKTFAIERAGKSEILNNFDSPKIFIEQSQNVQKEFFDVDYFGTLEDLTGFIQIKDFNLTGIKTKEEFDELKSIVESGFYI